MHIIKLEWGWLLRFVQNPVIAKNCPKTSNVKSVSSHRNQFQPRKAAMDKVLCLLEFWLKLNCGWARVAKPQEPPIKVSSMKIFNMAISSSGIYIYVYAFIAFNATIVVLLLLIVLILILIFKRQRVDNFQEKEALHL